MNHSKDPLPSVLRKAFEENLVTTESGAKVELGSNVALDEAALLYHTVRELRPTRSAEVGLAQGISTLAILQALHDVQSGEHHVMDPFQANYGNAGITMVNAAILGDRFRFYRQYAEEVLPGLPPLQFVFIDASHLFDLTLMEFILADKKLDVGGLIAFHDLWMPSLQKVIRYILSNRAYRLHPNSMSPNRSLSLRQHGKKLIADTLKRLPGSTRIFSPELLEPWFAFGTGNLVVLEKIDHDKRDWQFHRTF